MPCRVPLIVIIIIAGKLPVSLYLYPYLPMLSEQGYLGQNYARRAYSTSGGTASFENGGEGTRTCRSLYQRQEMGMVSTIEAAGGVFVVLADVHRTTPRTPE